MAEVIVASAVHADALASVHAAAFPQAAWDGPSFATLLGQPGVCGLLDPRGGVLLMRVVLDEAEILTIGVADRRRGIGAGLLAAGIDRAQALGVARLHLEVAAGNAAARAFYKSFGFTDAGRRAKYYADGDDAIVLTLRLEPR
jgi:ribosomal-protein-alanine N-acetyltransferase